MHAYVSRESWTPKGKKSLRLRDPEANDAASLSSTACSMPSWTFQIPLIKRSLRDLPLYRSYCPVTTLTVVIAPTSIQSGVFPYRSFALSGARGTDGQIRLSAFMSLVYLIQVLAVSASGMAIVRLFQFRGWCCASYQYRYPERRTLYKCKCVASYMVNDRSGENLPGYFDVCLLWPRRLLRAGRRGRAQIGPKRPFIGFEANRVEH